LSICHSLNNDLKKDCRASGIDDLLSIFIASECTLAVGFGSGHGQRMDSKVVMTNMLSHNHSSLGFFLKKSSSLFGLEQGY
jgi:hypothetical protein